MLVAFVRISVRYVYKVYATLLQLFYDCWYTSGTYTHMAGIPFTINVAMAGTISQKQSSSF